MERGAAQAVLRLESKYSPLPQKYNVLKRPRVFRRTLFLFGAPSGARKVFNEAGSRCCNIVKIVEIYIFFFDRLGGSRPRSYNIHIHYRKNISPWCKAPRKSMKIQNSDQQKARGLIPANTIYSIKNICLGSTSQTQIKKIATETLGG